MILVLGIDFPDQFSVFGYCNFWNKQDFLGLMQFGELGEGFFDARHVLNGMGSE
jgi:hypothetical protein